MWNPFKSPRVPEAQSKAAPAQNYYRLGRRFDPGAEAEVYYAVLNNPVYIVTRGSGRVAGQFDVVQPPQVWTPPMLTAAGLGGIQAGQYVRQGLLDPSVLESEAPED